MSLSKRLVFALVLGVGCAASSPIVVTKPTADAIAPSCKDVEGDATFITYNATIAPGIAKQATPRIPYVAEAIKGASYDVMCIQEAFSEHAKLAISDASGLDADHVFVADTKGWLETGKDRCDADEVTNIRKCVETKCAGVHPEETTKCAASKCRSSAIGLFLFHRSCLNCLVASAGKSIEDIITTCVLGKGSSRLYEGSNGMMMLSRHPMRDRDAVRLPSSGMNRVALLATVDLPSGKSVRVACTQLSTPASTGPTHPSYDDWTDEQQAQAKLVMARLRTTAGGLPTVLMGDFGFSISADGISALEQETWYTFARNGYWSPAMHVTPSICTSCASNTMSGSGDKSFLTDHIMLQNADRHRPVPLCADTVFTDTLRIIGYFGKEIISPRSGHYGLRMQVRFSK